MISNRNKPLQVACPAFIFVLYEITIETIDTLKMKE